MTYNSLHLASLHLARFLFIEHLHLASRSANLILFFVHFQKYVLIFNPTECCMTENSVPCLPVILNQWINGPTVLNGVSNYPLLRVESIPKFYSPCPSEEFDLVGFTVRLLYSLSTRIVKQKPSRLTWNQILFFVFIDVNEIKAQPMTY